METVVRETFETQRSSDFFNEAGLVMETGQPRAQWPGAITKELLDNALDACEEAGLLPDIEIDIDDEGITVVDNGCGLPAEVAAKACTAEVRVSSRAAYVAPDRGRQGNALKTALGASYIETNGDGRVEITSRGTRTTVTAKHDGLTDGPAIRVSAEPVEATSGTTVRVYLGLKLAGSAGDKNAQIVEIAQNFTWLNPHATFRLQTAAGVTVFERTTDRCEKWTPRDPPSAHWYSEDGLAKYAAACVLRDQTCGRRRTVREFVAGFDGLTRSRRQMQVLIDVGLSRAYLDELVLEGSMDRDAMARLRAAMQKVTKPVTPRRLGCVGAEHVIQKLENDGCTPDSIKYKRTRELDNNIPTVVECGFGCRRKGGRRVIAGINWSPVHGDPFAKDRMEHQGIGAMLAEMQVSPADPVDVFVHIASPGIRFADRGKSTIAR